MDAALSETESSTPNPPCMPFWVGCWGGGGRVLLKGVGGGVLEPKSPKVCVPKIAQINVSFCKFIFSHYEIRVHEGGG